ncbi:MAG: 2-phosphosulfolactate phosphatase, partial [Bacteroidales bacterium]|nr:2-phosphosulfolactate phosphatase [Bacteroidales bacterium]
MKIEVILSPSLYDGRQLQQPCTAVAVDVLRATTALCSMFVAGAQEVTPLTTLEELEGYREKGYLVAAERGGMKVEGAMLGNSPTEYA